LAPNPKANHALLPPPNLTLAIKNVNDADFIGLMDFYHNSICVLQLQQTGHLPDGCGCDEGKDATSHIQIAHHVPPHSSVFTDEVMAMVKSIQILIGLCLLPHLSAS